MSTIKTVQEEESLFIKGKLSDYTECDSNEGVIETDIRITPEEGVVKV